MPGQRYVLLDLLGAKQPWSPNTIRSRLALRFKGVDFDTKWLSYTEIKPLLSARGIPPVEGGVTGWTLPALELGEGEKTIMDSAAIRDFLEREVPEPAFNDDQDAEAKITAWNMTLRHLGLPRTARNILKPVDQGGYNHFESTRCKAFKTDSLDEYEKEHDNPEFWSTMREKLGPVVELLKAHEGPWFAAKPAYADIRLACVLAWTHQFEPQVDGSMFKRILAVDEVLPRFWNAAVDAWLGADGFPRV